MRDFVVNHLLDGFLLTAFPIAVLAGVISFVSPCVLPLVPGYLSFAAGFSDVQFYDKLIGAGFRLPDYISSVPDCLLQ